MSTFISRGLYLVLFTGGLTLVGAGVANAVDTAGDDGLLSGTQILAPVTAPVTAVGNAIGVLDDAVAAPVAAAVIPVAPVAPTTPPVAAPVPAPAATSGSHSVLGGTQAIVEATVPVTVHGNAISLLGDAVTSGATAPVVPVAEPTPPEAAPATSGSDSIAGGTQVLPHIAIPVTVGGNAISLLGDSSSTGAAATTVPAAPATGSIGSGATTSGSDSIAGGTQVLPDIAIPVTVGGNAISLLGDSSSTGAITPTATEGTSGGAITTGADGILGGTQILPAIALPVTVGGNAISVLGAATAGTTGLPVTPVTPTTPTTPVTPVTPTTPVAPVTPTAPTMPTTPSATVRAATVTAAASAGATPIGSNSSSALSAWRLAYTGVEVVPVLSLVAALLVAGLALALLGRRRRV